MEDPNLQEKSIKEDIQYYRKLQAIKDSEEFKTYFELQKKTVADKLLWAFAENNVKNWEDFCKIRGEIIARLQPIQEIDDAGAMIQKLQDTLDNYYNKQL